MLPRYYPEAERGQGSLKAIPLVRCRDGRQLAGLSVHPRDRRPLPIGTHLQADQAPPRLDSQAEARAGTPTARRWFL